MISHTYNILFTILICLIFLSFDTVFVYSFFIYWNVSFNTYNYMSLICSLLLFIYTIIVQLFVLSLYKKAVEHTIHLEGTSIEHVIISTSTYNTLEVLRLGGVGVLATCLFQISFTIADPLGEYYCYCKASISDIPTVDKYSMHICDVIAWCFVVMFFRKVF